MNTQLNLPTDEDRTLLLDSLRGFLETNWPVESAVAWSVDAVAVVRMTGQLATQGLLSLGTDPTEGGLQEVVVAMQELGRAACPAPLLACALANFLLKDRRADQPAVAMLLDAVAQGTAQPVVVLGTLSGDRTGGTVVFEGGVLNGEARYVDAPAGATHVLALVSETAVAVVQCEAASTTVTPTRSLGAFGIATLRFSNAPATLVELGGQALRDQALVMRLALAARAFGAAERAFELVVDYVKERKQFGKAIGSFQAIQHKLANNYIALEGVRLALDNAASHFDRQVSAWRFFASAACAHAATSLRQVALETQHAFGAIGYAEEHEAPRHFKRIHQDMLRFGGARRAREELAHALLDGDAHLPEYDLGEAGNAFRLEVRRWLEQHWTADHKARLHARPHAHREYDREFAAELGKTGWIGLGWPEKFGGQARSALEYLAYVEEMERAEAPRAGAPIQAVAWMLFGDSEQQQRFLPEILQGRAVYGMWYSEPDSGSDLASMRTRAVRDGSEWVIDGQKIWTTSYWGDYMWLAAKTDPQAQPAHAGISMFCIRTDTPGITIRPVQTMYDGEFVNTFFDNVRVPADALVGRLNGGWQVLTESLGTERSIVGATILTKLAHAFEQVCAVIRGASELKDDPVVRDTIGGFAAQLEAGRQLALRCVTEAGTGETPPHLAAATKVFAGELMERFFEAVPELLGYEAALSKDSEGAILRGRLEQKLRHSLMWVISIGTNEIQRNLIAQRGLGLPRR